jgi:hypothetical protein
LVAEAFDPSAHIQADHVMGWIVNGWVDPWLPEAAQQHEILGAVCAVAMMELAQGGYTVVVDGHLFPEGLVGLADACARRAIPLHYAVLRPDLETCLARIDQRRPGDADNVELFRDQHARYADLGGWETHVIDSSGEPADIASTLVAAVEAGRLLATPPRTESAP